MSHILVDSSIWIDYFRDEDRYQTIDDLIKHNLVCINDLILAELIPSLRARGVNELVDAMLSLHRYELRINWSHIIEMQVKNLTSGINAVGIPDLIIVDSIITNGLTLYTKDKHFALMQPLFNYRLLDVSA